MPSASRKRLISSLLTKRPRATRRARTLWPWRQVVDGLGCCTSGQRLAQQARDTARLVFSARAISLAATRYRIQRSMVVRMTCLLHFRGSDVLILNHHDAIASVKTRVSWVSSAHPAVPRVPLFCLTAPLMALAVAFRFCFYTQPPSTNFWPLMAAGLCGWVVAVVWNARSATALTLCGAAGWIAPDGHLAWRRPVAGRHCWPVPSACCVFWRAPQG